MCFRIIVFCLWAGLWVSVPAAANWAELASTRIAAQTAATEAFDLLQEGLIEEAVATAEAAITRFEGSDDLAVRRSVATLRVNLAAALESVDLEKARHAIDQLLADEAGARDVDILDSLRMAQINRTHLAYKQRDPAAALAQLDMLLPTLKAAQEPNQEASLLRAWRNKALYLADLGRLDEAIAVGEAALAHAGGAKRDHASLQLSVARNLLFDYGNAGRAEDVATCADDMVQAFGASARPSVRHALAALLVTAADIMSHLEAYEAGTTLIDAALARFAGDSDPVMRARMADLMLKKGLALEERGAIADAYAVAMDASAMLEGYQGDDADLTRFYALMNQAIYLRKLEKYEASQAIIERLMKAYRHDQNPEIQNAFSGVLFEATLVRASLGDAAGAVDIVQNMLELYQDHPDEGVQYDLAKALFNMTFDQASLGDAAGALATYDIIIQRYGDYQQARFLVLVGDAYANKAFDLAKDGRVAEAVAVADAYLARYDTPVSGPLGPATGRILANQAWDLASAGDIDRVEQVARQLARQYAGRTDPDVAGYAAEGYWALATVMAVNGRRVETIQALHKVLDHIGQLECRRVVGNADYSPVLSHPAMQRYLARVGCGA